ncbi:Bax inhibitor-1/YccA family protein [Ornithobacterium rhinotracheale]|uniref:Bax inhibitor-1/YccA family protein n=1 Tax=Ornithobacterium rhinotracheale TaxID=28251 RepID=UPI00129CFFA8|nr:Bax inhibitor-1/YccA family protein [Ornithobacterium rhinotracheale]MRJ08231.1 Bax inhibitor-1/YccA family protein [Ornithobacterium rhinotracheale]MRJ09871.1 Bax inhibitor-1/YccA family protein [Ornithobacterium rhinotracheale]UOH77427.1 Bax inhibitor-1/YccA family protein [Ornithobacterium rhinotracheale]
MNEQKSTNPILRTKAFEMMHSTDLGGIMTLNGVIGKSFLLILITAVTAYFSWGFIEEKLMTNPNFNVSIYLWVSVIAAFILALVISFKPNIAPFASPVYAVLEGLFLGIISMFFEAMYPGIATQAIMGTMGVFLAMLALYRFRIIKVTDRFKSVVFGATLGIAILYGVSILLSFFNIDIPFIHEGGWLGIGFSVFVVGIAALNLAIDFDFIETQIERGANKNMEWYAAFGLLVTLVWLYLEILRLLSKIRD